MRADRGAGKSSTGHAIDVSLPRTAEAPGLARAVTRQLCERLAISGSRCQTLLVLVSEVVTNAVKHSDGPREARIAFRAAATAEGAVRVDVEDGGSGFEPAPRDPSAVDRGWGLYLVDRESRSWGVEAAGGTRVWFEMATA